MLSVMSLMSLHVFLVPYGTLGFELLEGATLHSRAHDLPWQDELCCDSLSTQLTVEEGGAHPTETNVFKSNLPHTSNCSFRNSSTGFPHQASGGTCLNILCRIEDWEQLTCELQPHGPPSGTLISGRTAMSLQRMASQTDDSEVNDGSAESHIPTVCEEEDAFKCSIALDTKSSFVAMVTVIISEATAAPILLKVPPRPVKPPPPTNLSYIQTIDADLILQWEEPVHLHSGPLRCEVRYSSKATHPVWQVVPAPAEPRLILDLSPKVNYTIQVHCASVDEPPLWSDWSEPYHIYLYMVSYIPETVVARPGEDITVYCVFNDHSMNSSSARWTLNEQPLHHSQYHSVNQWVSQITVRSSTTQMHVLLQCTQDIAYSQIYVEGALIDIKCTTNGDIDSMDCSWNNALWEVEPSFTFRWADLTCDVMEEREKAGETVGRMGPKCLQMGSTQKTCTIKPLRMNCYKLWLQISSDLGPIRSKPIYLSPLDHVKPHPPTNVKAVSKSSGVLHVSWEPPSLPVGGLRCQCRHDSWSPTRGQLEWEIYNTVRVPKAEVPVPNYDPCHVYVVQVRCMHISGTGYWSDWSDSFYSTPQNRGAPKHGPDFWRILQDDANSNQTNVTLLIKPASELPCSVDGFIIQHKSARGGVTEQLIDRVSSYSFMWNHEVQTVTVKAYNHKGSSVDNINMTLDRTHKRPCVRSFRVLVINGSCVNLHWRLVDDGVVPLFMLIQWSHHTDHHKDQGGVAWARVPYTEHAVYLKGHFFGAEEYRFYLYPVFADGEGEPVYATGKAMTAARGDRTANTLMMIVFLLSAILFVTLVVTLVVSQNQMKRFVWKDVPNPNKCSWAKGVDFKKADTIDHLFQPPEGLPAWPLLLPSENISKVAIVEKNDLIAFPAFQTPLVSKPSDPASALTSTHHPGFSCEVSQTWSMDTETLQGGAPASPLHIDAFTTSNQTLDVLQHVAASGDQCPGTNEDSAQSSVTYTSVMLSGPLSEQQPLPHQYKDGSGSSSGDEGNFSANNSETSGSLAGGLLDLESCRDRETDDSRRSCSYSSEFSETSKPEDEATEWKDLYYLNMDHPPEDDQSKEGVKQEEEEGQSELLSRETLEQSKLPPYRPQFRTALHTRQVTY